MGMSSIEERRDMTRYKKEKKTRREKEREDISYI